MKVFFSSELMVWLSLTPIRIAAKLVPCGTIWTWCGAGLPQLPILNLPCGAVLKLYF